MRGVEIWRSGGVQSPPGEVTAPAVTCLCHGALSEWHFEEVASYQATMEEAISLEKELNDMHGLAIALHFAAELAEPPPKPKKLSHREQRTVLRAALGLPPQ